MSIDDNDRLELIQYSLDEALDVKIDVYLNTAKEMFEEMKDFISAIDQFIKKR
jgi:hypothetical protein